MDRGLEFSQRQEFDMKNILMMDFFQHTHSKKNYKNMAQYTV